MIVEYHSRFNVDFYATPHNREDHWRFAEPFLFSVDGETFQIPVNFWIDFASVPRVIWPVISPYDLGVGPGPHDYGYRTKTKSRGFWDDVLRAFMEKDKIARWRRVSAYNAVRMFGGAAWARPMVKGELAPLACRSLREEMPAAALNWKNFTAEVTQ